MSVKNETTCYALFFMSLNRLRRITQQKNKLNFMKFCGEEPSEWGKPNLPCQEYYLGIRGQLEDAQRRLAAATMELSVKDRQLKHLGHLQGEYELLKTKYSDLRKECNRLYVEWCDSKWSSCRETAPSDECRFLQEEIGNLVMENKELKRQLLRSNRDSILPSTLSHKTAECKASTGKLCLTFSFADATKLEESDSAGRTPRCTWRQLHDEQNSPCQEVESNPQESTRTPSEDGSITAMPVEAMGQTALAEQVTSLVNTGVHDQDVLHHIAKGYLLHQSSRTLLTQRNAPPQSPRLPVGAFPRNQSPKSSVKSSKRHDRLSACVTSIDRKDIAVVQKSLGVMLPTGTSRASIPAVPCPPNRSRSWEWDREISPERASTMLPAASPMRARSGELPPDTPRTITSPYFVTTRDSLVVTFRPESKLGLRANDKGIVTHVDQDSTAEFYGIQPGMCLQSIDSQGYTAKLLHDKCLGQLPFLAVFSNTDGFHRASI